MWPALLPILGNIGAQIAKSFFPDPADAQKARELELTFQAKIIEQAQAIEVAAASIVKAEAESSNWLTASWRPITMLTFVALIVARWLGYSAPGISEEEILKLWDIIQLGLGGYVIGRSAEKVMPAIAAAMGKR